METFAKWIEDILWAIHKILMLVGIVKADESIDKDTEEDYSGYLPK